MPTNNEDPAVVQFARENPALAAIPTSGLIGGMLAEDTKRPVNDFLRGGVTGLGTGAGAVLGPGAIPAGGYGQAELLLCRSNQPGSVLTISQDGTIKIEHGRTGATP